MHYICTRAFTGRAINNLQDIDIRYGKTVESDEGAGTISDGEGNTICRTESQVGHQNFARDDDGNGLERGVITYKIAFDYPFTNEQLDMIREKYAEFVRDIPFGAIMFNNDFFKADIEVLRTMAEELGIEYTVPEVEEVEIVLEELKPVELTVMPLKSAAMVQSTYILGTSAESDMVVFEIANDVPLFDTISADSNIGIELDTLSGAHA